MPDAGLACARRYAHDALLYDSYERGQSDHPNDDSAPVPRVYLRSRAHSVMQGTIPRPVAVSRPSGGDCAGSGLARSGPRPSRSASSSTRSSATCPRSLAGCRAREGLGTELLDEAADLQRDDRTERDRDQRGRDDRDRGDEPGLLDELPQLERSLEQGSHDVEAEGEQLAAGQAVDRREGFDLEAHDLKVQMGRILPGIAGVSHVSDDVALFHQRVEVGEEPLDEGPPHVSLPLRAGGHQHEGDHRQGAA